MNINPLIVDLNDRSYPIYIGTHLLENSEFFDTHIRGRQVMLVTNTTIAELGYLSRLQATLSNYDLQYIVLPDGESFKTLEFVNQIFDALLECRFNRSCTVIALGGGVIGDMSGFSAACYQRGVDFIQVPTTLLSQVDSSVGGKTGVNHPAGKNMIGAFYQPQSVVIDTASLLTLPDREFSAGLAEVIKYGIIYDAEFLDWIEANLDNLLNRDNDTIALAIRRSCEIKAEVVAIDERESGIRAILNLGHTFGHAIETELGYGKWLHGEAVSAGMLMALSFSRSRGWVTEAYVQRVKSLLERASLPVSVPAEMTDEAFLTHMAVDKKVIDGRLRIIAVEVEGKACVVDDVQPDELLNAIADNR